MLAKYLVVLGVSSAMPREALWCCEELCATALAAAFGYATIQAAYPGFHLCRGRHDELDAASVVNGLAVTEVCGSG